MTSSQSATRLIAILAFTQIASWGSAYYAFAILAPVMQPDLGISTEIIFGAFSWSLLVAGLCATPAGMLIDRIGGRRVMPAGSLCAAAGFLLLGLAHSAMMYVLAWTLIGMAMAGTLYEAAFATINGVVMQNPRRCISILTLFGGLASTVFWPLTLALIDWLGWRNACLAYAGMHFLLCLPLHLMLPRPLRRLPALDVAGNDYTLKQAIRHPAFWHLAFAFAANSFIFSAMSVHLIPLLRDFGHPLALVVGLAALIGPMQVLARLLEMGAARHTRPQMVGIVTFSLLPAALLMLLSAGGLRIAVVAFCILYGLSNGILTIVRGTVPQALFGRENYGAISGALAAPALIAKAAGPLAVALVVQATQGPAALLWSLLAVSLASLGFFIAAIRPGGADADMLASGESARGPAQPSP
ncbi:Predicted arabinose efflux permease, MFS family [Noviherbaspirillum humi]|uniref:Predicted arabinose efflux permease, MFS family n=1 Tax=Noviherbaspirillum humi TaxID=1688639 RepID=A0A239J4G3_9BURK|nr:MFS transporter [Noviherbaspirillum humi]SNT00562.1 Predicted arabinose efflux permease, MFS family [Noviherbaspirillum humi]